MPKVERLNVNTSSMALYLPPNEGYTRSFQSALNNDIICLQKELDRLYMKKLIP